MNEKAPSIASAVDAIGPLEEVRSRLRRGNLAVELLRGGTKAALRAGEIQLSHDELRDRVGRVAGGLAANGVREGDRVAIYASNSLDWAVACLGLYWLGAVVVAINPAYKSAEAEHIFDDSDPRVVISDQAHMPIVMRLGRPSLLLENLPLDVAPELAAVGEESPALIIYTSGTTGTPKGAVLDHGNLLAQIRGAVDCWRWSSRDRLVHALPLFHLHGLGMGLHGTLITGAAATLMQFSPEGVLRELTVGGGTMFFGVPAMYQRICDYLDEHPVDLSAVRLFVSGSAPLPPALFDRCARLLGQPPIERYGITEGGIVVSNPYDGPRRAGRVGHPLPGVEVALGDKNEIWLKGGQVFSSYWDNPAATTAAFTADRWFRTGDIGEIADDGSLAIRGRLKELIISGGFNVYPREVELVLEGHSAVAEVAVIGLPSDRWGEEVTAFVVLASGTNVTEAELITYAREQLADFKCPRAVRFTASLPRNAMGKVQRDRLAPQ